MRDDFAVFYDRVGRGNKPAVYFLVSESGRNNRVFIVGPESVFERIYTSGRTVIIVICSVDDIDSMSDLCFVPCNIYTVNMW